MANDLNSTTAESEVHNQTAQQNPDGSITYTRSFQPVTSQVTNRPGQTAPVPLPTGLQPDQNPMHAMLTADGSQSGEVPISQMAAARAQGHHIAIPMKAPDPDNRTGFVPLHRWADAAKVGFKPIGQYKQAIDNAVDAVRNGRADISTAAADAIAKHTANYDLMPPEIQDRLKEMVEMGVGFFTGGILGPGGKEPTREEQAKEPGAFQQRPGGSIQNLNRVMASPLVPVGVGEPGIEPSEPAMQLGRVPERPIPVERQLAAEPGPRTIDVQATAPGKYAVPEPQTDAQQIVKDQGMVYKGELSPGSGVHMVEHPNHPGKTTAVTEPVTPEKVNDAVGNVLTRFGVKADTPQTAQETLAQTTHPEDQRIELRNAQNRTTLKRAAREDYQRRNQAFEATLPKVVIVGPGEKLPPKEEPQEK